MNKLPAITAGFWIMKIAATTLGETAGDLLSMTLNVGYGLSSLILISIFLVTLIIQLCSTKYHPFLYWTVILSTSTAGTTMSDYMDRTLGLGYANGSAILVTLLVSTLLLWRYREGSISVQHVTTRRVEILYWIAILFSNTLGTALGDYLADDSGLGFIGGALLISSILGGILAAYYYTNLSRIALFWAAFVLTRPFGATFGDLLTKPVEKGGLDLGTAGSSLVLFAILLAMIVYSSVKTAKRSAS
ncbi:MAG: hypothetical protein ACOYJ2_05025 [Rickettsiales bacterium]